MTIYEKLMAVQDTEYREFQSRLVPNIPKDTIIGVRTPEMRQIAKDFFVNGNGRDSNGCSNGRDTESDTAKASRAGGMSEAAAAFLMELPHKYYEENMVHFFLISMIKDFDECVTAVERFLPFIDCWPVCDQSSPKAFKKNHEKLLPLIKKWIASEHVYTARFGMRMLMNEFLGDDFKSEYLELVAAKSTTARSAVAKSAVPAAERNAPPPADSDDYYLKMMVAWYFATALAKQYDASLPYIESRRLEPWTHNKAIQKALESFRVSDEHKEYLKSLRTAR